MFKRWQEKSIKSALNSRRVVILSGSRQCGKTTTSKVMANKNSVYRTLDDSTLLQAAKNDPQGFIKLTGVNRGVNQGVNQGVNRRASGIMIIDEIQRVPELITAIKKAVDENTRYGQYLITGSVNIQTLPTVKESLAGRVKKIRLRPLVTGEILKKEPQFLSRIKKQDFVNNYGYDKEKISELIFKGGFPEPLSYKNSAERVSWYKDYINTVIEFDLHDIANIKRQDSLKELVSIIASFSSKFIDKSKITASMGIANQTLDSYLAVLENTYLIDKLSPWLKTDYERVNKQSKYFITDTGLMASLLNWKEEDLLVDADKSGKIFETFVYNQLVTQIELENNEYELYHYRDREKREIDFIIQDTSSNIYGIEVKAGSSVTKEQFKHMKWFKENLAKGKSFTGIVLYTGEHVIPFGENMLAVPMNNLWD